jgi:hypothetical protein
MSGVREMSARIGQLMLWAPKPIPGFGVSVTITDVKTSYGNTRYEIQPVAGEGRLWVDAASVRPAQPEGAEHGR